MNDTYRSLLIFAAFCAAAFWFMSSRTRKALTNQRLLGGRLGLDVFNATPQTSFDKTARASGELRGRPAEILAYRTYGVRSSADWIAIAVRSAHADDFTFAIRARGILAGISERFGEPSLITGDQMFDKKWLVQSNQPERLAPRFTPELRAKLMAARSARPPLLLSSGFKWSYTLTDGLVKYSENGTFSDTRLCTRIPALLDITCDLAEIAGAAPEKAE